MSAALTVPHLSDGVVLLRPPVAGDAPAVFAACQDPEIGRFTSMPAPYEPHHASGWIAGAAEAWQRGISAPMVIVGVATGELLGACGLIDIEGDHAEIGYWVTREMRGRGVATQAVVLVTQWALGALGLSRVELLADVRNVASQRVAEKAGYTRDGEAPPPARCAGRSERMVRFVRTRPLSTAPAEGTNGTGGQEAGGGAGSVPVPPQPGEPPASAAPPSARCGGATGRRSHWP